MLVVYYLQMHPLSSGHTDIHSELVQEVKDGLGCWMFPFGHTMGLRDDSLSQRKQCLMPG
jgi:hypothetical protein